MATRQKLTLAEVRELLKEAKREAKAVLADFGEGRQYLNAMAAVKHWQRVHDRREYEEIQADRRAEQLEEAESLGPDALAGLARGDKSDAGLPWEGLLP
jgi:hypothetical protein